MNLVFPIFLAGDGLPHLLANQAPESRANPMRGDLDAAFSVMPSFDAMSLCGAMFFNHFTISSRYQFSIPIHQQFLGECPAPVACPFQS